MESLKEKTAKGLFWGGFSNGVQQLLNLVFGIFLGRLLSPSDYGMVGMLTIFSSIASALQEGGFISALNKRSNVSHNDYNAVFWFSSLVGAFFYVLLFFCAPLISRFYDNDALTPLSRFLFVGVFISSLSIAPRAYLFRNLMVKENTIISITCLLVSGIVGVGLAMNGFAYWGIAAQSVVFVTVVTVLNFYFSKWRPSLKIDFRPIREMFGFSSKLIITNIFNIFNANLFSVLLGKFYSANEVGNFNQANKWNNMGHTLITNMLGGVAQPVFTKVEDDRKRQLAVFRKLLRFTALVSFPAMLGLSLISKEFIVIMIKDKWINSAVILQVLCLWGAFYPINQLFSNLIISRGRSSVYMWCTIILCVVQAIVALLLFPYGLMSMIYVFTAINILWLLVWHYFVHKEIGLRLTDVIKDISPYLLISLALAAVTYFITRGIDNIYLRLLSKIAIMASLYCVILWSLGSVIFREAIKFILKKGTL